MSQQWNTFATDRGGVEFISSDRRKWEWVGFPSLGKSKMAHAHQHIKS